MIKKILLANALLLAMTGCATGLNSGQATEYKAMEAHGLTVQEKNPTAGAFLGLLPGGGSFYAREPAFGVLNLLLWPLSILWDPVSGYDGSMSINYYASKATMQRERMDAEKKVRRERQDGLINDAQLMQAMRDIEDKYSY